MDKYTHISVLFFRWESYGSPFKSLHYLWEQFLLFYYHSISYHFVLTQCKYRADNLLHFMNSCNPWTVTSITSSYRVRTQYWLIFCLCVLSDKVVLTRCGIMVGRNWRNKKEWEKRQRETKKRWTNKSKTTLLAPNSAHSDLFNGFTGL